jgi:hypothetical protein
MPAGRQRYGSGRTAAILAAPVPAGRRRYGYAGFHSSVEMDNAGKLTLTMRPP